MKRLLSSTKINLTKTVKIILVTSVLNGCAGIPANKIKLEDYPEIKINRSVNLSYTYEWPYPYPYKQDDKENLEFNQKIGDNLKSKDSSIKEVQKNDSNGCQVKIAARVRGGNFFTCPIITNLISIPTLTIVPYYCQHIYEAHATLISYPKDSEITGNILPSITQAKAGDLFLDENNRAARLLKTYDLKDKVHEVWSSLWMLSWFVVDSWGRGPTPEGAKDLTKEAISEALVRSILNDAKTFPECTNRRAVELD